MTKQKIVEVRDDLNRLIDALNPGSPRAAVARAVEKLDAILDALPAEPEAERTELKCPKCDHPTRVYTGSLVYDVACKCPL